MTRRGWQKIESMRRKLRAASRVGLLTGATVFRVISLFALTVVLGRSEGAESLGLLSLLLAIAAVLQAISVGGLAGAAIHALILDRSGGGSALLLLVSARMFLIPLTFAGGALFLTGTQATLNVDPLALVVFFVGYAIGSFDVGELGKTAKGQFASIGSLRLMTVLFAALPKFLAAAAGDFSQVLIWQGVEAALWQLVLLPGSGFRLSHLPAAFRSTGDALRQTWNLRSLWLSNIMSTLAQRVDLFVVSAIAGQAALGQYSTASRPVEAAVILAGSFMAVIFNGLVQASSNSQAYSRLSRRNSLLTGGLGLVCTIALIFVGPPLISLLYGPAFSEAARILSLYALSTFFVFQRQFLSRILIIEKAYRYSLLNNFLMLFTSIVLNCLLIPSMGLAGAALAAVLSHPISLAVSMLPSSKGRQLLMLSFGSLVLSKEKIVPAASNLILERSYRGENEKFSV